MYCWSEELHAIDFCLLDNFLIQLSNSKVKLALVAYLGQISCEPNPG